MDHDRSNAGVYGCTVRFCDVLKLPDECTNLRFGGVQQLEIVAHQNDIITNRLKVDVRQTHFGAETGFHGLGWSEGAKACIKNDSVVCNSIAQVFQGVDVFEEELAVGIVCQVDADAVGNILSYGCNCLPRGPKYPRCFRSLHFQGCLEARYF